MSQSSISEMFRRMGARVKVHPSPHVQDVEVNVRRDGGGEYFVVRHREDVDVAVLECAPWNRHLVLAAHDPRLDGEVEADSTFLCGHDERHWFVAAVPGRSVATVSSAMDALKPPGVAVVAARMGLSARRRGS